MTTFTILWKDAPRRARTSLWTIQATDRETAEEAAFALVWEKTDGAGVVIGVVEGDPRIEIGRSPGHENP